MGTAKEFKKGKHTYWIFHSSWGYTVESAPIDHPLYVKTVAPTGGKFFKSKTSAKKALDKILKGRK